jgi:hypothetical protein
MYKSVLSLGLIASTALAQSVSIGLPTAGAQLYTSTNATFQIQRPVSKFYMSYCLARLLIGYN